MQRPSYSAPLPDLVLGEGCGGELAKKAPLLWSFLVDVKWDDGTSREPGALLVFTGDGAIKGMLKDNDAGMVCFLSSDTWGGLLGAIQKALDGKAGDWRPDRGGKSRRGKASH